MGLFGEPKNRKISFKKKGKEVCQRLLDTNSRQKTLEI